MYRFLKMGSGQFLIIEYHQSVYLFNHLISCKLVFISHTNAVSIPHLYNSNLEKVCHNFRFKLRLNIRDI